MHHSEILFIFTHYVVTVILDSLCVINVNNLKSFKSDIELWKPFAKERRVLKLLQK